MDKNQSYKWRILISIDQLANTLLGGNPDETISSRWGRAVRDARDGAPAPWYARYGCWALDKIDKDHCRSSIEYDDLGNPMPHHFQGGR
jgi:hypothetical protein